MRWVSNSLLLSLNEEIENVVYFKTQTSIDEEAGIKGLRKGELQTGDSAPDFTLHTVDEQPISLSGTLNSGRKVLLVFLRHLG